MASKFSIIRYVPDIVADERVNIGVVVVDDQLHIARCRFVSNWSRATKLAGGDASHLKQVALAFEAACNLMVDTENSPIHLMGDGLQSIASEWDGAVQLSAPKPILMDADTAATFVAARYLSEAKRSYVQHGRSKAQAIQKAKTALEHALEQADLDSHRVVLHKKAVIQGERSAQHFDYGVKNGVMKIGGFGISFETGSPDEISTRIAAIGFTALDIKEAHEHLPVCVIAIGERKAHQGAWKRFDDSLSGLGVDLLREDQIEEWSEDQVARLTL